MRLTELEAAGACLWISRQTLREYLSALSRPSAYSPPIPMTSLIGDVSALLSPLFALDLRAQSTGQAHREPRRMVSIGARREARQAG